MQELGFKNSCICTAFYLASLPVKSLLFHGGEPNEDESMPNAAHLVLQSYRELLHLIKRLPLSRQPAALLEARERVRANRGENNQQRALDMHKEMVGRIGFLRMSLPRQPGDRYARAGRFVLRGGELVEGEADRETRWAG